MCAFFSTTCGLLSSREKSRRWVLVLLLLQKFWFTNSVKHLKPPEKQKNFHVQKPIKTLNFFQIDIIVIDTICHLIMSHLFESPLQVAGTVNILKLSFIYEQERVGDSFQNKVVCLVGCRAMWSGRSLPTFQRCLPPPSRINELYIKLK
jgi:hypothetical protein